MGQRGVPVTEGEIPSEEGDVDVVALKRLIGEEKRSILVPGFYHRSSDLGYPPRLTRYRGAQYILVSGHALGREGCMITAAWWRAEGWHAMSKQVGDKYYLYVY